MIKNVKHAELNISIATVYKSFQRKFDKKLKFWNGFLIHINFLIMTAIPLFCY